MTVIGIIILHNYMTKFKNIVGLKFGELLVLDVPTKSRITLGGTKKTYHLCLCSCGIKKEIEKRCLSNGNTVSCGCKTKELISKTKIKSIKGLRFNKLIALKDSEIIGYSPKGYKIFSTWCRCECGIEKFIRTCHLLKNNIKSCGCEQKVGSEKRRIKLEGKTFGLLKIISQSENQYGTMYKCLCKCGKKTINSYSNLISEKVTSCGNCKNFRNGQIVSNIQFKLQKLLNRGILNYKFGNKRIDIAIVHKNQKIAIEYDGWYWHKNKNEEDIIRDFDMIIKGWKILHIKSDTKLPTIIQIYQKLDSLSTSNPVEEIILDDWKS